jgi:lipopolysaccharide/colanic/teichoic acid biosynthesis glycosyltransferase
VDSKRAFDIIVGSTALVVALPLLAGVAIAMRLSGDRGPFLYRANRVGKDAKEITILKVRTMAAGTNGSRLTTAGDRRVTPLGRVLRRYRIDELPQLINVLRGEMSLVGPRPEDPFFVDLSDPIRRHVLAARPGITGLAQLQFRDEAVFLNGPDAEDIYRRDLLPEKLRVDAAYVDQQTTWLDIKIILRTARAVFS